MLLLKVILIGFIAFFSLTGQTLAKSYPDVQRTYKHFEAITALSDQNTITGYPNGRFKPNEHINRAEAVKILISSQFDSNTIESALDWHRQAGHSYAMFADVLLKEWFSAYVEVSYKNRIVDGYPDGLFRPADNINFAEALKMILKSHNVDVTQVAFKPQDLLYVKKGEWFEAYFSYAYEHNLINQEKFYHPGQLMTRGEFVEVMHRLQTIQRTGEYAFKDAWNDVSNEYTITIPKLNIVGLNVNFADIYNENGALNVLKDGLGHYLSPPDAKRKMVLFGHSSGYSWDKSNYKTILRQIDQLSNGDRLYINYKEKGYVYEIFKSDIIAASQDYKLIENQQNNELTLYTCWPPNSIKQRYVVYGKPIS